MQIVEHMEETKSNSEKVRNFFRKASVCYAANDDVLSPEQYMHRDFGTEVPCSDNDKHQFIAPQNLWDTCGLQYAPEVTLEAKLIFV